MSNKYTFTKTPIYNTLSSVNIYSSYNINVSCPKLKVDFNKTVYRYEMNEFFKQLDLMFEKLWVIFDYYDSIEDLCLLFEDSKCLFYKLIISDNFDVSFLFNGNFSDMTENDINHFINNLELMGFKLKSISKSVLLIKFKL